jgi:hypothetical protein
MADDIQQQVDELLADLSAALTEDSQPDPEAVDELADRADELVSTTDLTTLLAAAGIGDEDERPESLPAAVAEGEPENVAAIRSLLTASKLSTADEGREELVDELRSLVETMQGEPPAEAATETTSDATETTDAAGEETEAAETEQEADEESTSPIRDLLESQLEETHGIFDGIPDLETLTGGLGGDDGEETETVAEDESHEDQSTRKSDGTRWRPGGGKQRTTHSTVPSAGRRDIGRRPGKFSSVRGSTVSKR